MPQTHAQPLVGKRILITRAQSPEGCPLEKALSQAGAQVSCIPLLGVQPIPFEVPSGVNFDWALFSSKHAVEAFFSQAELEAGVAVASVGTVTAEALKAKGVTVDFIPTLYDARSLAHQFSLRDGAAGSLALWPCGNLANQELKRELECAGVRVHPLTVYQTVLRDALSEKEGMAFDPPPHVLVFTSPSAVEAFCNLALPLGESRVAVLGGATADYARKELGRSDIIPAENTLAALALAIQHSLAPQTAG